MLWKLLAEMKDDQPTHLAVVFDKSEKTFRSEFYPAIQGAPARKRRKTCGRNSR